jgi:DNA repair exonuclease SbcCD ATPase subunit
MGVVIATKQQSLERVRKRNQQAHGVIKDIQGELANSLRAQEKAEEELAQLNRKLQKYGGDVEAARQELAKAQEFIEQISNERDDAEEKAETARKEAREALERMALEQAKAEGMLVGRYEGVLAGWENGKYQGYTSARAKVLEDEKQRMMQRRYELKERYPQLDVDTAFNAVPSPDSSVDGLPLELLEKKAPISPSGISQSSAAAR